LVNINHIPEVFLYNSTGKGLTPSIFWKYFSIGGERLTYIVRMDLTTPKPVRRLWLFRLIRVYAWSRRSQDLCSLANGAGYGPRQPGTIKALALLISNLPGTIN
jgi:hypothetical protein